VPTRFADVERIERLSGQRLVPILEHDGQVIFDSWDIALHLQIRFQDRPNLFGPLEGRGLARLYNVWCDIVLGPAVRRLIAADFIWCLDPGDRAYYRRTREEQLRAPLELVCADRDRWMAEALPHIQVLERAFRRDPFLCGEAPAYADYIVFSVFQWARIGSPSDILPPNDLPEVHRWRTQMIGLFENLADRFGGYPAERSGPDGT
jgi:glutathione S-transferase